MRAYTADMIPGGASPVINVSQYDNDYAVTVTLIEGAEIYTPPSGATIMVEGTKPDGNGFSYACTYQGNVVTVPIYTQMTAVAGRFPIELVVYQSGLRVGSCNITLAVERAPLDDDEIISDSDIPAIISLAQSQADAAASSATSAETAKDAAMDAAQDAIDAAQELQTAIQFNAALIHETASGTIARFADGADDIPMQSVVAEITPIQDLNGQANPYPPGGGKNKLPDNGEASASKSGVTFTRNADGTIKAVGTATDVGRSTFDVGHVVLPAGTYTISGCPSGGVDATYRIRVARDSYVGTALAQEYGTGKTITLAEETDVYLRIYIQPDSGAVNQIWKPQIESGSIATAYAPYSNICPISGRTGMTVTHSGKNLIRNIKVQGNASTVTLGQSVATGCETYLPAGTWTFSYTSAKTCSIYYRDEAADAESRNIRWVNNAKSGTITLTEGAFIRVWAFLSSGISAEEIESFQIEAGSTATDYEPYTATTIPITWETEAGTIYGGTLDVVSGVLTVEYGKYTIPSDISVTDRINSQNRVYWNFTDMMPGVYLTDENTVCNRLPKSGPTNEPTAPCICIGAASNASYVYLQGVKLLDGVTDLATLRTWLEANSVEFTYKLATPQTYQLTPTEVRTILGGNTIYTDAGAVSVEYIADTKMYIDNKIAELQALVLEN